MEGLHHQDAKTQGLENLSLWQNSVLLLSNKNANSKFR